MFKRLNRFIHDKGLIKEIVNILMGILMVVALLVFSFTKNVVSICCLIILGALMNITNGIALVKNREKKTMGLSMIMLGIVILLAFSVFYAGGYIR